MTYWTITFFSADENYLNQVEEFGAAFENSPEGNPPAFDYVYAIFKRMYPSYCQRYLHSVKQESDA